MIQKDKSNQLACKLKQFFVSLSKINIKSMKKSIFFVIALLFAGIFFWQISLFDFTQFTFYGLMDQVFLAIDTEPTSILKRYLPGVLLMGIYLICLIYLTLLQAQKKLLVGGLLLLELLLYFLLPKTSFYFVGGAFALGSIMLILQIIHLQKTSIRLHFFDLSHKAINQFMRYVLIIMCLYNFTLIKNQPFNIPASALNAVINNIEDSLLENSSFSAEDIKDLNTKLCEKEGVDTQACLSDLADFMQTEDLDQIAIDMGHTSSADLNLHEIVNLKMQEMLAPYQSYIPYIVTLLLFSTLYFVLTLLIFVYAILATIAHRLLLKTSFVKTDIREVPQEYLI